MAAAGAIQKSLYPKLFHVTCIAHLLHICAIKVKSHFEDVDQLNSQINAIYKLNQTSQIRYYRLPPSAFCYNMGNWLNAVLNYAKNL